MPSLKYKSAGPPVNHKGLSHTQIEGGTFMIDKQGNVVNCLCHKGNVYLTGMGSSVLWAKFGQWPPVAQALASTNQISRRWKKILEQWFSNLFQSADPLPGPGYGKPRFKSSVAGWPWASLSARTTILSQESFRALQSTITNISRKKKLGKEPQAPSQLSFLPTP